MAILDEILKRIKQNTLDKTDIDERIVNAVRPIQKLPQQIITKTTNQFKPEVNDSLSNRFWRSGFAEKALVNPETAIKTGNILTRYKQPEEFVKKNPWSAFTNSSLDIGNTLLKMPTQVGYDLGNKRVWQGKESPISDPVNLGTLLPEVANLRDMNTDQKKRLLTDIFNRSVESAKPVALASGLNAPKIVATMTGLGGVLGYGGARLEGQKGEEARNTAIQSAGEQFGRGVIMAGLMRFTNPLGDKLGQLTLDQFAKQGYPKLAQYLAKYTMQGGLNTAEGIALNPLVDRPMFEDVLVDFLTPGVLDISGKSLKGIFRQLKDSIRNQDPEGFDNAIRILKEQGVKIADSAINEVRLVIDGARNITAPEVQFATAGRYLKGTDGRFIGSKSMGGGVSSLEEETARNLRNTEKALQKEIRLKDTKPPKPGFTRTFGITAPDGNTPWRFGSENELRKWIGGRDITGEKIVIEDIPTNQLELQPNGAYKVADQTFKGYEDLSTKTLEKLKGRTTVSKQFIADLTNTPDLKQSERDLIRGKLQDVPDKVNVKEFADAVKSDLLSLQPKTSDTYKPNLEGRSWQDPNSMIEEGEFTPKYEYISLEPELRGDVANYKENVYESPIKTKAGETHFNYLTDKYFGHTRVEDMADDKTRRIIEVQSDLYQKGNLEKSNEQITSLEDQISAIKSGRKADIGELSKIEKQLADAIKFRDKDLNILQQYNNPTAHFRMIREEVKKASIDGKSILLFPTGETAMKIEGLAGRGDQNFLHYEDSTALKSSDLKYGQKFNDQRHGGNYIIVEKLDENNFKAIPLKYDAPEILNESKYDVDENEYYKVLDKYRKANLAYVERFTLADDVDKEDPIYKFYNKEIGNYLKSKYNASEIRDDKGVSWWKVNIKPEFKRQPVEAFGLLPPIAPDQDEEGNFKLRFAPEVTLGSMAIVGGLREIKKGDLDSTLKSLNKLPDFKGYGENAKDMIVKEAKRLADSIEGVQIIQNSMDGRGIRRSMNPQWYRSFYSNNGRPPTNDELFKLAEENLRTGRLTGEVTDPGELKAINEFLDAEIKGTEQPIPNIMPKADTKLLPGSQNVPLLRSPEEVITSKKKLIEIFKKTGEVKPFLNRLRPKTKPIPMGAQVIPSASTGDEARAIKQEYGKVPEVIPQSVPSTGKVYEQPGLTIEDRGKRIEEILYGSATPSATELGGTKEGAGFFSNLLRKGQGMVSDRVGEALSSSNPIVRNTASVLQDFAGNLGKSGDQVTKRSQFSGGIDYATKLGNDTQKYVTDLVGKDLGSLERIHSVLDPELATTKVNYEDLTPKEKEATDFLRYVSDFINETNFKNGFITEEKYRSNTGGKYIARAYEPYDFPPELADFMQQRNQKLDLNPFKERGDVTDWKQENAVRDPAYLVAKRLQQTMFNDNFRRMSDWMRNTDLVSDTPKPGYVQVSDHKAYGEMAGKFVRKDALEDIKGFFFANQTAQKAYDMLNWWDKLAPRRFRKKMLTVFNPAVRLGNNVGNYVFAWFNGINPVTFNGNRGWAKNAIKGNDPLYRRAIQDGLLGSDLTRGDIQRFASELKSGTTEPGILKKIDQVLTESYGRVDDVAKLSALKTHLDRGYTYEEAFKRVYNGFQNYNAVGFLYDIGAKVPILGNPFVRFKADILRMMKNAVLDHPVRAVGTVLAWKMFTDITSLASGETPEDKETRESRLGAPRIPFTDVSLAVQTPWGEINASRLIGLYSLNQLNESSPTADAFDYLPFEKPELKNIGSDPLIGGALAVATDTDFRGKKISDPDYNKYTGSTLTDEEKNANRLKYLARSYNLPTLNDIADVGSALQGEPNFYGQNRTPLQAILRTAGLKVEQYGADEAQLARDKDAMYSANAIEAENRRISQIKNQLSRGEITEDQANSRINAIQKNIDKMQSKLGGGNNNVAGATTEGTLPESRVKSLNTIFNVGSVSGMPEGTNYEKAQKQAKQFEIIDKVLDSDFLTPDEQESYIAQTTKFKKEEIGYYRIAKGGTDERYGFVLDKIEEQPKDLMSVLATMRYEIDEKKILTNNLIDRLEDDGYISNAQAKLLKKLEYNQNTGKISKTTSSGSDSDKVAKAIAKLNRENGEDLKAIFDQFAGASKTRKSSATPLLEVTQQLNSIGNKTGSSIQNVLNKKRQITPIAKLG